MTAAATVSLASNSSKLTCNTSTPSSVGRHTSASSTNSGYTLCDEPMFTSSKGTQQNQQKQQPQQQNQQPQQHKQEGTVSTVVSGMASLNIARAPTAAAKSSSSSRRNSSDSDMSTSASIAQAIAVAAGTAPRIEKRPSLMQRFLGTASSSRPTSSSSKRVSPPASVKSTASNKRGVSENTMFEQRYGTCSRECIGRGATAVVRVAYKQHRDGPQVYAIKRFRKQRANETERDYIKKLTSEYCISSSIQHKNVVSTLDLIQDPSKNWCQVMEFCPGGDLYTIIRDGNMGLAENECCFKQMCEGIAQLHSMGVCHRDIKAENMLLDARSTIKITDFGVADVFRMAWQDKVHKSRGLCGSEPYIAPEMFNNKSYDGRKVDVWSAAVVYYTMVYNGIPWRAAKEDDANYTRFLDAMRNGRDYEGFRRIEPKMRRLIQSMLNPDAQARPTIDEVMQSEVMQRIVICDDEGMVPGGGHHCHYTEEYEERKNSQHMRAQAAAAAAGAANCRASNSNNH